MWYYSHVISHLMKGFVENIEVMAEKNTTFRTVLYTARHLQLVVMCIPVNGDIGEEVHELDQFLRIESGTGVSTIDGVEHVFERGYGIVVPAGARHNIINTGTNDLKMYTLYGPPNHRDGVVHAIQKSAEGDSEPFDGVTSE